MAVSYGNVDTIARPSSRADLSRRLARQAELTEHNRRMLKLRSNGQAYRDRLVRERLNLRRAD